MKSPTFRLVAIASLVVAVAPARGRAQEYRGVVRDSATQQPIPGVVVTALAGPGTPVARFVTNRRGEYRLLPSTSPTRIRVQRLGFRLREVAVAPEIGSVTLDIAMMPLPSLLEAVQVVDIGSRCPASKDGVQAYALLQQARAALLATVVTAESNPAALTQVSYERTYKANNSTIASQAVRIDSAGKAVTSFSAAQSASDFVNKGFTAEDMFLGPDANVLLDESFSAAYCFRIVAATSTRPNQVGLGFEAADHAINRVDIAGTIWIDTAARALRDIEYFYAGFRSGPPGLRLPTGDAAVRGPGPSGGTIVFREMRNGVTLIDRWTLRPPDLGWIDADHRYFRRMKPMTEGGGELISARWADGTEFHTTLPSLRLHVQTKDGLPAVGALMDLVNTNYYGLTDSTGDVVFHNVFPGPYALRASDRRLAELGMVGTVVDQVEGGRDTVLTVEVGRGVAPDHVRELCTKRAGGEGDVSLLILGRFMSAKGEAIKRREASLFDATGNAIHATKTDGQGFFVFCLDQSRSGQRLEVRASDKGTEVRVPRRISERVNTVLLQVPPEKP